MVAATNHHKFSGLKAHIFIILQSVGQRSKIGLTGLTEGVFGAGSFWTLLGRICFLAFSGFPPWLMVPPPPTKLALKHLQSSLAV